MSYFAVERDKRYWDHVFVMETKFHDSFKNYFNMSYDEMKSQDDLEYFVIAWMETVNHVTNASDDLTVVTLVGDDDVFIWSIFIIPGKDYDELRYSLVDWKKDGRNYRYTP